MAKVSAKGTGRSVKTGQYAAHPRTVPMRTVKPAPSTGSFSREEARAAVLAVMREDSKKAP